MADDISTRAPRGRWLRYSLRTLLVLVTGLAMVLAYSVSRFANERAAVERLLARRATIVYFDQSYGRVHPGRTLGAWLREFAGLRWPGEVYLEGKEIDDAILRDDVLPLRTLARVGLTGVRVTDEGLGQLSSLESLVGVTCIRDSRNEKVMRELDQATMIEVVNTPLQDCVEYLIDLHDIPIEIDKGAVSAPQWDSRSQLTATVKGKPLCDALMNCWRRTTSAGS